MAPNPIIRRFQQGFTFRWQQGENVIDVKRGYVREGKAVISLVQRQAVQTTDIPEVPREKDAYLVDTIPVMATSWSQQRLRALSDVWLQNRAVSPAG